MDVLVADDQPLIRMVVGRLLEDRGDDVVEVADGLELIERLAIRRFDVIVTDVAMGWFGGIPALAAARAAGVATPALVITGNPTRALEGVLARLGGTRLLEKPFRAHELYDALDALLASVLAWPSARRATPPRSAARP